MLCLSVDSDMNHKRGPWKAPLPEFIEGLCFKKGLREKSLKTRQRAHSKLKEPTGNNGTTAPRGLQHRHFMQKLPAAFSPDGKVLAVVRYNRSWAGDYEIVLHDMTTGGDTVIPCQGCSIGFSPDGKTLAVVGSFGVSESLRLLDPATAKWNQTDQER
jgi:hypothetical protein